MSEHPLVSVLTRTFRRPIFLQRCFAHLRAAMPENGEWLIVDDVPGGDAETLQLIETFRKQVSWQITYLNSGHGHRTKALNSGLKQADGTYFHILDDDDTVQPDFYRRLLGFLDEDAEASWGAVACLSERVDETLIDGQLQETGRRAHYPELRAISFAGLATTMMTPPCSLIFRRAVIGSLCFDETMRVAEDHAFLLQFLCQADIAVVREVHAAFHQRPQTEGAEQNSEISQNFTVEKTRFQNALMRRDLASGRVGIGWLVTLAELNRGSARMNVLLDALYRNRLFNWLFQKVR